VLVRSACRTIPPCWPSSLWHRLPFGAIFGPEYALAHAVKRALARSTQVPRNGVTSALCGHFGSDRLLVETERPLSVSHWEQAPGTALNASLAPRSGQAQSTGRRDLAQICIRCRWLRRDHLHNQHPCCSQCPQGFSCACPLPDHAKKPLQPVLDITQRDVET
jgi:hypothetical protein